MGVDSSIKVRFFDKDLLFLNEIKVTEQDNALASLFFSHTISCTSIEFDKDQELTEEENEFMSLEDSDEEEMISESKIMTAKEFLFILDKIHRKIYRLKSKCLEDDLHKISLKENVDENQKKQRINQISEYLGFENSFGILLGIVKTAKALDLNIQLINEFY